MRKSIGFLSLILGGTCVAYGSISLYLAALAKGRLRDSQDAWALGASVLGILLVFSGSRRLRNSVTQLFDRFVESLRITRVMGLHALSLSLICGVIAAVIMVVQVLRANPDPFAASLWIWGTLILAMFFRGLSKAALRKGQGPEKGEQKNASD